MNAPLQPGTKGREREAHKGVEASLRERDGALDKVSSSRVD